MAGRMKREEFLSQPEVESFIEWLVMNLPKLTFRLQFKPSRFVPAGLMVDVAGFENVIEHYRWKATWQDTNQCSVSSQTWAETKCSLGTLREWLADAVSSGDEQQALKACLEILRWGGVRGAIPFLHRKAEIGALCSYLQKMAERMALDGSNDLNDLNRDSVERFDAGLTKIHALLDRSGSPIYDSRVGAAIAMLHSLFQQEQGGGKYMLTFPSGAARGSQVRDPGAFLNGLPAPQFSKVSYANWARCQVRLGWIIRSVLERTSWFIKEGPLSARCHAFEASLFMLGYDLRCFGIPLISAPQNQNSNLRVRKTARHDSGWVPTGHPFTQVLTDYLAFRKSTELDNKESFVHWMLEDSRNDKPLKRNTAQGYCFAFSMREFDLFGRSVEVLERIVSGGEQGLRAALSGKGTESFTLGDEREAVCLVDVFITGNAYLFEKEEKGRVRHVLDRGYAGTENAARTLLALGRNVGQHFGLLDKAYLPTAAFDKFYHDFSLDS